jgi:gluconolactonase
MTVSLSRVRDVRKLVDVDAHEGPVYVAEEQALYFTMLPQPGPLVAIARLDLESHRLTTVRADANAANGMTLAPDGRLLACEQGTLRTPARIALVDRHTGETETLVDTFAGRPLNSPNDVVVARDGAVWFTDPSYGYLQGFRPEPSQADNVYRFDGERLALAEGSFDKPNGLAFSPDEEILYVGDSGANHEPGTFDPRRPHHIRAFDVVEGRRLTNGRDFAMIAPGFPDGLKVDGQGRVYSSAFDGIHVFAPSGELLEVIDLPGAVNFVFGGTTLYVTTDTAIWSVELQAKGA